MRCKSLTAVGNQCKFNATIGDYCIIHWRNENPGKGLSDLACGKDNVDLCPICKVNYKMKKSKKCKACASKKCRKGMISRTKSIKRFE